MQRYWGIVLKGIPTKDVWNVSGRWNVGRGYRIFVFHIAVVLYAFPFPIQFESEAPRQRKSTSQCRHQLKLGLGKRHFEQEGTPGELIRNSDREQLIFLFYYSTMEGKGSSTGLSFHSWKKESSHQMYVAARQQVQLDPKRRRSGSNQSGKSQQSPWVDWIVIVPEQNEMKKELQLWSSPPLTSSLGYQEGKLHYLISSKNPCELQILEGKLFGAFSTFHNLTRRAFTTHAGHRLQAYYKQ